MVDGLLLGVGDHDKPLLAHACDAITVRRSPCASAATTVQAAVTPIARRARHRSPRRALLLRAARGLTQKLYKDGYRYKKAGVDRDDLTPSPSFQADLWAEPDSERSKALMRTIDRINADHGRGTLRYAMTGTAGA